MEINCTGCASLCCKDPKTPVLLPSEEEKFKEFSQIVKTPFRDMHLLGKKKNGSCILLDDTGKCKKYDERPIECRLYPFLSYMGENIEVKLDEGFCPNTNSLKFEHRELVELIKKYDFPRDWLEGYESLGGY